MLQDIHYNNLLWDVRTEEWVLVDTFSEAKYYEDEQQALEAFKKVTADGDNDGLWSNWGTEYNNNFIEDSHRNKVRDSMIEFVSELDKDELAKYKQKHRLKVIRPR